MHEFDPGHLRDALASVPAGAWSLPSTYASTRVHHGYRRVTLVDAGRRWAEAEPFDLVLQALAPVHGAWLSWIDPGGFIVPHRDAGPWRERWQVPIAAAGRFHHDTDTFAPADGVAFAVQHWRPHAVVNDTDRPRIHVVVDRDVWLPLDPLPFAVFPVPDHMTDLVARSQ